MNLVTFDILTNKYMLHCAEIYSEQKCEEIYDVIQTYFVPTFAFGNNRDITPEVISEFTQRLGAESELDEAGVLVIINHLKSIVGMVPFDLPGPLRIAEPYTANQMANVRRVMPDYWRLYFDCRLLLGLSHKDVCTLKRSSFDEDFTDYFTGNDRVCPVPPSLTMALVLADTAGHRYLLHDEFATMDESTFDVQAWAPALAECGIGYQPPDHIRATYLRLLMETGVPENDIAAISGIDVSTLVANFGRFRINHAAYLDRLVAVV